MKEMELTRRDVLKAFDKSHQRTDYPERDGYGSNCRIATTDTIAVVYDPDEKTIVTVLWAGKESRGDRPPRVERE